LTFWNLKGRRSSRKEEEEEEEGLVMRNTKFIFNTCWRKKKFTGSKGQKNVPARPYV
jgi:hypothetical protein